MKNDKNNLIYLARELRFSVTLIKSALEETERFDLVLNDPSYFMFMSLASQGIERLLKLSLSYDTIIKNKRQKFSPKRFGHKINKLYRMFNANATNNVKKEYRELFLKEEPLPRLLKKFTDLLEYFANQGRYHYTSKESREKRFTYHLDEHYIYLVTQYNYLKIYEKNCKKEKYLKELNYATESAKLMDDPYYPLVPKLFSNIIGFNLEQPFWSESELGYKLGADDMFKIGSREFLLIYIKPIISMLEEQFGDIMEKFNMPYDFYDLTSDIKYGVVDVKKKKYITVTRDVYSEVLL